MKLFRIRDLPGLEVDFLEPCFCCKRSVNPGRNGTTRTIIANSTTPDLTPGFGLRHLQIGVGSSPVTSRIRGGYQQNSNVPLTNIHRRCESVRFIPNGRCHGNTVKTVMVRFIRVMVVWQSPFIRNKNNKMPRSVPSIKL